MMNDDMELLREYASHQSEPAFEALVARHVSLVHSAALRQVRDPHLAEEITQTVFIILARKADSLNPKTILPGWLYRTTRYASAAALKIQYRRERREQEAHMLSTTHEAQADQVWEEVSPMLDEAMAQLRDKDRDALVLRYFQNKSLREVGTAFGQNEYAAQKRVGRALEKLRKFFSKRGVVSTTTIIAGAMSANSVQAAPVLLAKSVTAVAIAKGAAASGSTLTLIKGALKIMAWSKVKTTFVVGVGVLLVVGTATITIKEVEAHRTPVWQEKYDVTMLDKLPPQVAIRPSLPSTLSSGLHVAGNSLSGKFQGLGQLIPEIIMVAYYPRYRLSQLNFPTAVPQGKFDFIANFPGGVQRQQEELRQELKLKFGLIGHPETNEAECLILKVKTRNAPGLKRSSMPFSGSEQDDSYSAHNQILWPLVDYLADHLGTVVIDQTGLTGSYDIDFEWDKTLEGLKQALLDQTGLELVSSNMPIETLVVEKVK